MKKLIIVLSVALLGSSGFAFIEQPEEVNCKDLPKRERKECRKAEAIIQQEEMKTLLESKAWVLEAHTMQLRNGQTFHVTSTLNFIGVAGEEASVQLGTHHHAGLNGVGGITLDGDITRFNLSEGKKAGSGINLELGMSGASSGFLTVWLTVSPDGTALAQVTDISGNRLTFRGHIVSLEDSRVFKGTTTFRRR